MYDSNHSWNTKCLSNVKHINNSMQPEEGNKSGQEKHNWKRNENTSLYDKWLNVKHHWRHAACYNYVI